MENKELKPFRDKLDAINSDILDLLILRFKTIDKIKTFKIENKIDLHDKTREKAILGNIESRIPPQNSLFKPAISEVFKTILSSSLTYMKRK